MNNSTLNAIIVKVQKTLDCEGIKGNIAQSKIDCQTIKAITNNLKDMPYAQLKVILMTLTAEQIIVTYGKQNNILSN